MDPLILTAGEAELVMADVDEWLDRENCDCEGVCLCEEENR